MIGIIGAMDIEVDALKKLIGNKTPKTVSGVEFICGTMYGRDVAVAKCGVGKVNAALCAEAMITEFSPDLVINTGVAGSLTEELSVLDVALAKAVVQHDFDLTCFGRKPGEIPDLGAEIHADPAITLAIEGIVKGMGVKCRCGVIATGDRFIASEEEKTALAERFGAIACEMEGGAIGHVCRVNKIPFAVVRAISDSADNPMDYETFSVKAANLSANIIKSFIMSI